MKQNRASIQVDDNQIVDVGESCTVVAGNDCKISAGCMSEYFMMTSGK